MQRRRGQNEGRGRSKRSLEGVTGSARGRNRPRLKLGWRAAGGTAAPDRPVLVDFGKDSGF